jgi:hypothetical protein
MINLKTLHTIQLPEVVLAIAITLSAITWRSACRMVAHLLQRKRRIVHLNDLVHSRFWKFCPGETIVFGAAEHERPVATFRCSNLREK